jgi:hypothetical protein
MAATPHTEDPMVATLIERIDGLRADVNLMRSELSDQRAGYVSRAEFDAWRSGIGRELADYKTALREAKEATAAAQLAAESRRPSGLTVAVAVAAIIATAANLIPFLSK